MKPKSLTPRELQAEDGRNANAPSDSPAGARHSDSSGGREAPRANGRTTFAVGGDIWQLVGLLTSERPAANVPAGKLNCIGQRPGIGPWWNKSPR